MELNTRRGDFRDAQRDVLALRRELVPLTTGLISDVKRKRTLQMRNAVRLKKKSVVKIQVIRLHSHFRYIFITQTLSGFVASRAGPTVYLPRP